MPLPSIERLKGKILLKDKVKRKKDGRHYIIMTSLYDVIITSYFSAGEGGTLPRNAHGLSAAVIESMETAANGELYMYICNE